MILEILVLAWSNPNAPLIKLIHLSESIWHADIKFRWFSCTSKFICCRYPARQHQQQYTTSCNIHWLTEWSYLVHWDECLKKWHSCSQHPISDAYYSQVCFTLGTEEITQERNRSDSALYKYDHQYFTNSLWGRATKLAPVDWTKSWLQPSMLSQPMVTHFFSPDFLLCSTSWSGGYGWQAWVVGTAITTCMLCLVSIW